MKFTTVKIKQPLYGRCDTIIHLRPFATSVLKQILSDYYPRYDNDDLPAFVAEVKRQGKNFRPELFEGKVNHLRDKILNGYKTDSRLLTLNDM